MITDPDNIQKVEDLEPLQKSSKQSIEKEENEDDKINQSFNKATKRAIRERIKDTEQE